MQTTQILAKTPIRTYDQKCKEANRATPHETKIPERSRRKSIRERGKINNSTKILEERKITSPPKTQKKVNIREESEYEILIIKFMYLRCVSCST